ncbi:diaminopimelate epimerase [Chryseobacterium joostei]|uniref:Diaminopimelate epimerase n=1 Tax=Chryseobacterium joostei TaxID=112234 RepID=A0A1N7IEW4_9FLAO|nr:diaminopimelate epimerase [Chryseobacterium joostei]AZA98137.1 diaminopimelate epimerase [Chryseobacterium joostei]SIS35644.1 diaminopimelate epimerase [Chryseobacterium joostei]
MEFYKYQGTGNDFVMVDNRDLQFPKDKNIIEKLCDRRFGIGSDGLILLENDPDYDFKMVYYNSDGGESTMCGNGGRCLVAFAFFLDVFEDKCKFIAIDGEHDAEIHNGIIKLKMIDVNTISHDGNDSVLNTGSPHYVKYVENLKDYDVYTEGHGIRNSENYKEKGINVNFIEKISDNEIFVRTYERGVEDETYSCGTGVTASALTFLQKDNLTSVKVKTLGGNLKVYAEKSGDSFCNIWLEGPAKQVFKGKVDIL